MNRHEQEQTHPDADDPAGTEKQIANNQEQEDIDEITEQDATAPDRPDADDAAADNANETPEEEITPTIESVIEAILFASDEPLSTAKLADIAELQGTKQVHKAIETLNENYSAANNAFRIEQIAGGFQMMTLNIYNSWLKKLIRTRSEGKLTAASLETLAIIAYKQPVIRADIEAVRGVASGEIIRTLMHKGLVKITGRAQVLGRPMLYGTTKKFLQLFGLNSLKDLPTVDELKKPQ